MILSKILKKIQTNTLHRFRKTVRNCRNPKETIEEDTIYADETSKTILKIEAEDDSDWDETAAYDDQYYDDSEESEYDYRQNAELKLSTAALKEAQNMLEK